MHKKKSENTLDFPLSKGHKQNQVFTSLFRQKSCRDKHLHSPISCPQRTGPVQVSMKRGFLCGGIEYKCCPVGKVFMAVTYHAIGFGFEYRIRLGRQTRG